jgi:hypothetical protein
MVAAAVGGAVVAGGIYSSSQQGKAAGKAADAQSEASQAGIEEQKRQFDAMQALLKPYVTAGNQSLSAQQDLLGLNGTNAQQQAINGIKAGPAYTSAMQSGANLITQNAAATGGLRGGNTQDALSRYGGDLLTTLTQNQFSNLGGLTSIGQNSAAQTGNAGMQSANNISTLLAQQGSANAGGYIAQGNANAGMANSLLQGLGAYGGISKTF